MSHCEYPKREVVIKWVDPDGDRTQRLLVSRWAVADLCVDQLKATRDNLKAIGAKKAVAAVARALKSVEGARRNAERFGWHELNGLHIETREDRERGEA